ncbi:hypothetical protein CCZ01_00490 [Helicobacter monodelphidis]|uniref:DNA-processing protein DprA n=1 Tax=Helicobacter sp. 15-1451 TaxID=2004995 RepID=UPI000DCF598A|nr:DNA-processing protein DprA [Helicobacter sp. 15-1451]RAX59255.1 hypothetical protein CCZ01_00490 [Helicobacter sp. 15-1451]
MKTVENIAFETVVFSDLPHAIQEKFKLLLNSTLAPKLRTLPRQLYVRGCLDLLNAPLVAVVGTRKPNPYTRTLTQELTRRLSLAGAVIVSGGAIGVDILAHKGAQKRTICFSPAGIETYYPLTNVQELRRIATECLFVSEYTHDYMPHRWSFLERNRLIIAIADWVVIPQADLQSGSMHSANLAKTLKKPLFVLPHRLNESKGTQQLLHNRYAEGIFDIDEWIQKFKTDFCILDDIESKGSMCDPFYQYCATMPSYDEALGLFGDRLLNEELMGHIQIVNGRVELCL